MKAILDTRDPDVVQTHNVKSHFLMRWSGASQTRRWIAFQHGYTTTDFRMRCYNQLDRWSLPGAHHVVTVCRQFADDLVMRGVSAERITVQHNSIKPFPPADLTKAEELRKKFPASSQILLSVGRLSHEKGHVDLITALGIVRRKWPSDDFHLVLAGEGPARAEIEKRRDEEGLASHVTLVGLQHDIQPYYSIADLVVMPSHSEGSPNALLEAMIAGTPVVATRAGDPGNRGERRHGNFG